VAPLKPKPHATTSPFLCAVFAAAFAALLLCAPALSRPVALCGPSQPLCSVSGTVVSPASSSSRSSVRTVLLAVPEDAARRRALYDSATALLSVTVAVKGNNAGAKTAVCVVAPGAAALPPFTRDAPCGGRGDLALTPEVPSGGGAAVVTAPEFVARFAAEVPRAHLDGPLTVVLENHNLVSGLSASLNATTTAVMHGRGSLEFWAARWNNLLRGAGEGLRGAPRALASLLGGGGSGSPPSAAASGLRARGGALGAALASLFGDRSCAASAARSPFFRRAASVCLRSLLPELGLEDVCTALSKGNLAVPALLLLNAAAFATAALGWRRWAPLPLGGRGLPLLALFTHQFEHAGLQHLAGNMLTLLFVGDEVFIALGCSSRLFLVFFVLCGVCGGLAARLLHTGGAVELVGASGAVSGVMMGLVMLRPHAAVVAFGRECGSPLMWALGKVAADVALNLRAGTRISWQAHAGGFLAGAALSQLWLAA